MRRWTHFYCLQASLVAIPIPQCTFNVLDDILILVLYVDDLIVIGSSSSMLQDVKHALMD